ncbi:hypothetical protein C8R45DRAFT_935041 [Mycena sanguinolenta]|nr:hypothetical protein C8R45DRAFT_935041 [Mycena sanguinolenta]
MFILLALGVLDGLCGCRQMSAHFAFTYHLTSLRIRKAERGDELTRSHEVTNYVRTRLSHLLFPRLFHRAILRRWGYDPRRNLLDYIPIFGALDYYNIDEIHKLGTAEEFSGRPEHSRKCDVPHVAGEERDQEG